MIKMALHCLWAAIKNPYGSSTSASIAVLAHKVIHRNCAEPAVLAIVPCNGCLHPLFYPFQQAPLAQASKESSGCGSETVFALILINAKNHFVNNGLEIIPGFTHNVIHKICVQHCLGSPLAGRRFAKALPHFHSCIVK